MNKNELQKTYQKIVLKTNGGVDDYVVALCQIGNAISELDDQQQQITDLQHRLDLLKKALELACENVKFECPNPPERYNAQDEYGSDEPYWIEESVCEFADEPARCLECQVERFMTKAEDFFKEVDKNRRT